MTTRHSIGSMFMYEAAQTITINAVNQYHAVYGFSEGVHTSAGVTFGAGATGSITDTADASTVLRCTSVGHGLTTGQYVTLTGMGDALHVGTSRVTVVDVDTFDCDDITYNSIDDTGFWSRGSSLTVQTGFGGFYQVTFSASIASFGINKDYKFEAIVNATSFDEIVIERKISTASDLGAISTSGPILLSGGDVLWMKVENTLDTSDLLIEHANMHMHRI